MHSVMRLNCILHCYLGSGRNLLAVKKGDRRGSILGPHQESILHLAGRTRVQALSVFPPVSDIPAICGICISCGLVLLVSYLMLYGLNISK